MSESFTPLNFDPAVAARELFGVFEERSTSAIEDLRLRALDDAYSCAHLVRAMAAQAGRSRLGVAAAALATLLEVDASAAQAITAWTVARSEAVNPNTPNDALQMAAESAIERIAVGAGPSWQAPIERWPVLSRSVCGALSEVLASPVLPSGPEFARVLQRGHEHLGDSLLGSVPFPDHGACRLPVMAWVAPAVSLYLDVDVINTTMLVLLLADRDPATRTALQSNGAEHALERELVASGEARRRWAPHHMGRRLVMTQTVPAPLDRVTLAVPGADGVLLANEAGRVEVWSPARAGFPQISRRERIELPAGDPVRSGEDILGGALDRAVVVVTPNGLSVRPDEGPVELEMAFVPVQPSPFGVVAAGTTGEWTTFAVLRTDGIVELHTPFPALMARFAAFLPDSRRRGFFFDAPPDTRISPALVAAGATPVALAAAADGDSVVVVVAHDAGITAWWPDEGVVRTIASDPAAAKTRCLSAGKLGGSGVVLAGTTYGADLWAIRTGLRVAALEHARPIVDCDWADIEGRPVVALTDEDGLVQVWDVSDLTPVTSSARSITGAATARFATFDDAPYLVTRTIGGAAELRKLALATVVDEVPEYHSDDVAAARQLALGASDALQRDAEADAIAEVVTSRSVHPPLAIGLFGEWGEGKSYFMERIGKHVSDRSDRARNDPAGPICTNVRQVRFNAWHYAEADLWASLVSELFEQLARSETEEDPPGSISLLRAELVRQRKLKERLDAAKSLQRELDAEVASRTVVVPDYEQLPVADREALEAALGVDAARTLYDGLRASPAVGARVKSRATAVARGLRNRPRVLLAFFILIVATTALVVTALLTGSWRWWVGAAGALPPTLVVVGSLADTVRTARRRFDHAWDAVKTVALDVASDQSADATMLVVRRDVVAAEVAQLQGEYERVVAAGQLAGLLEERLRDGTYRSRLGLMSQIHRDFLEMADLLAPTGPEPADEPPTNGERPKNLPTIERIALYIDDLDRCPPARVVEVLEAIHLLLAVPLFVVVVAVDPRWLLRALNAHYRQLLAEPASVTDDGADLWRTTPIHYLEKIFQIPFTLSPLDRTRYERFVDELVGPNIGVTSTAAPVSSQTFKTTGPTPPVSATAIGSATHTGPVAPVLTRVTPLAALRLSTPPDAEELDPLLLHDDERSFLRFLGPPLVTTPRAVKRLVNSYGLLLALRGRDERTRIIGPTDVHGTTVRPHRAALTLLAAVVGAPDASPAFFTSLYEARTDLRWGDFIGRQLEYGGDTTWLAKMLIDITAEAAASDEAVPPLVAHWREWIVPCGRLSFQTGRVVVRLPTHGT